MKICKQCGQLLDESCFRKIASRSTGKYSNTTQGYKTSCRSCEALNMRAHNAMKNNDQEVIRRLVEHYSYLRDMGCPPVTAAAQRLLTLYAPTPGGATNEAAQPISMNELQQHLAKVRDRSYSSVDEADAEHRRLTDALRDAGLYEETTNLLDDWYMDE